MESIIKSVWDSFSGSLTVNEIIDLGYFKDYCELLGIKKYTEDDIMFEKMLFFNNPTPPEFLKNFIRAHDLSEPFLERFIQYQKERGFSLWKCIIYNHSLSDKCIELYWKDIISSEDTKWFDLIICQDISEGFVKSHWLDIEKNDIITLYKLSDNLMESHWEELLDYKCFYENQKFSENFIRKHWESFNMELLIKTQLIPEDLLENILDIVDISTICAFQQISENMIEKYKDSYFANHWDVISEYQKLSDEYIKNNLKNYINIDRILINKYIGSEMKNYIRKQKTLIDLTLAC